MQLGVVQFCAIIIDSRINCCKNVRGRVNHLDHFCEWTAEKKCCPENPFQLCNLVDLTLELVWSKDSL